MTPDQLAEWMQSGTGLWTGTERLVIGTIGIIVALWVARVAAVHVLKSRTDDPQLIYKWRKGIAYTVTVTGAVLIAALWLQGLSSLATYLGLLSAGLAVALRDLVENVAGWVFIVWRRPFKIGERIEVGEFSGDVVDIRIFQFSLQEIGGWVGADQTTGRIVHVPCAMAIREPLVNYSRGVDFIWNEVPVLVTFESDWKGAKQLLTEVAESHTKHFEGRASAPTGADGRYLVGDRSPTPSVYTKVQDSGVLLTIRYPTEPEKRRTTEEGVWEDILERFATRDDIDFAYPTSRFYDNRTEAKPGLKAD